MKKMITVVTILACVALISVYLLLDCRSLLANDTARIEAQLGLIKVGDVFRLSESSTQGEMVYVIRPYDGDFFANNSDIDTKQCVKDKLSDVAKSDEGVCQLLFVKDSKAVAYAEIPRTTADFANINQNGFHVNTSLIIDKHKTVHIK